MGVGRPYIGLVLTICFPAHGRSDHKLRPDVPGGYLARHAPVWPGNFRLARSDSCSFADVAPLGS